MTNPIFQLTSLEEGMLEEGIAGTCMEIVEAELVLISLNLFQIYLHFE
jgi:hypothetical protein